MIQTLTAYTFEIDDPEAAAEEILEQIDLKQLRSNSLGVLTCSMEFLETGTVEAVSKAMPFDVIGCTTAGTASSGELGEMMLSLLVLTSDEVRFSTGCSESLKDEQEAPLEAAYRKATEGRQEKAAMLLVFAPLIRSVGGEIFVETLNRITGGLPIFGTLAIDTSPDFSKNRTFFNGTVSQTGLSFALLYGDIHPSFHIASISEEKIQKQRGVITKSKSNVLMEVNNMPLLEYLKNMGLKKENSAWESSSIPLMIDYNDGTKPIARSMYMLTPEGYAICGGFVPENATLTIGGIDYIDVLRTTSETLDKIQQTLPEGDTSCILMFACFIRYQALGANTTTEMEKVKDGITGERQYQFCYSGGEICPVYTSEGKLINRFHNCTFVACVL